MEGQYCYQYPRPAVTTDCVIFGFDGEVLKVLLVERGGEPYKGCWAFPGGFLNMDETTDECAVRELEEETGYRAGQLTYINSMYLSPGFANEKLALYLATDLQKVENPRPQDEDEILELYELTIAEAKAEVAKGTICDAKTLFAIQYWELYLLQRQFKEDTQ